MVATSRGASISSPSPAPQQHGSNSGSKCSHSRSQPAPPFSHHYDHQRSFEDSPLQRQHSISATTTGVAPDTSGMQRNTQSGSEGCGDMASSGGIGMRANVVGGGGGGGNNVISAQLGIKNLVHDVQLKRQKEIRDMMKK